MYRLHQGKKSRLKIFKSRESDHMNPAKLYCVASTLHSLRKKSVKSLDAFELIDDTAVRIIVSSTTDKCLLGLVMILDTRKKWIFQYVYPKSKCDYEINGYWADCVPSVTPFQDEIDKSVSKFGYNQHHH